MCLGNKGSPPGPSSASTTGSQNSIQNSASTGTSTGAFAASSSPNPETLAQYQNFLDVGWQDANYPYNGGMYSQVAPLNSWQEAAGLQQYTLGMNAGNFDPAQVRAIESPYTEDVVNATQNWFNNQNAIQGNSLLSQGIRAGNAFGGDRAGVGAAELAGQQQLAQAPVIAGLRQAGYTQALDEFNRLRAMGLSGAAMARGYGDMYQSQAQREADVQTQNNMLMSSYPYQVMNWLGSVLGGIGPLTGQMTAGISSGTTTANTAANTASNSITNPPAPNQLNQALGLASAGLGAVNAFTSGGEAGGSGGSTVTPDAFFGNSFGVGDEASGTFRRGGLVGMASGGMYDDSDNKDTSNEPTGFDQPAMRQQPERKSDDSDDETYIGTMPEALRGDARVPNVLGTLQVNRQMPYGNQQRPNQATPTSSPLMQSQQTSQPQQSNQTNQDNSLVGGLTSVLKLGAAAAPLFLLDRGGLVPKFQDGGEADNADNTDDGEEIDDGEEDAVAADAPRGEKGGSRTMPGEEGENDTPSEVGGDLLAEMPTVFGGPTGSPAGLPEGDMVPVSSLSRRMPIPPGEEPTGSPAGLPEGNAVPLPTARPGGAGLGAGLGGYRTPRGGVGGGGGGMRTQRIPGLGGSPRSGFASLATNPFWLAGMGMLSNRSPYFGPGLASGMAAVTQGAQQKAREEQLDRKPQMITHGDEVAFRVGDKIVRTGIKTRNTELAEAKEQLARDQMTSREKIAEKAEQGRMERAAAREKALGERSGTPSKTEAGKMERERDRIIEGYAKSEMTRNPDIDPEEADRRAAKRWNKKYPNRPIEVTEPEPAAAEATPAQPEEGAIKRGLKQIYSGMTGEGGAGIYNWVTGGGKTETAAPAAPATPAPTAQAAPAPDVAPSARLADAIKTGKMTPDAAVNQARMAIARNPAKRLEIVQRLIEAGIDPLPLMMSGPDVGTPGVRTRQPQQQEM